MAGFLDRRECLRLLMTSESASESTIETRATADLSAAKRGLARYFGAQQLLTRLPCPAWTAWRPEDLAFSTKWFPTVGLIIGGLAAIFVAIFGFLGFSGWIIAVIAVAAPPIFTGGFHEDAFADVCDAFGGMTPQRRREIMRDSLIGSFGAAGISLILIGKVAALSEQTWRTLAPTIICAHVISRWSSVVTIRISKYVNDPESLAKPYAGTVTNSRLVVATLFPTLPLSVFLFGPIIGASVLAGVVLFCLISAHFFRRWIGGVTGDCLGALNQLCELGVYFVAAQPTVSQLLFRKFA